MSFRLNLLVLPNYNKVIQTYSCESNADIVPLKISYYIFFKLKIFYKNNKIKRGGGGTDKKLKVFYLMRFYYEL
jgi:hypothetical protein